MQDILKGLIEIKGSVKHDMAGLQSQIEKLQYRVDGRWAMTT